MTLSTPDLFDARKQEVRVVEPLFLSYGGTDKFFGQVRTVKCHEDNALVKALAAKPGEGRVMVVDGGGSRRRALVGDMIAGNALRNGWAGLLIWGMVRDVDELRQLPLGVKAVGAFPVPANKEGSGQVDVPVAFGNVEFRPGDWLYADNNGILVASTPLHGD